MSFSKFKSKRGRKPLDELERKSKIAISLDPDVIKKLELEVNKSSLINTLLKNYYLSKMLDDSQPEKLDKENQQLLIERNVLRVELNKLRQKLESIKKILT
jgi:hypothetical protein